MEQPEVVIPTSEDFRALLAMNPLATAQLEAIVWKRIAREALDTSGDEENGTA